MVMIYRTDRDRRMVGDTILARREQFEAIHPAVSEVFFTFAGHHNTLAQRLDELRREVGEDQQARSFRDGIQAQASALYAWSYNQLDALLTPSWEDPAERVSVDDVRDRLFPLGSPSKLTSSQKLFDGLTHLKHALTREAVGFSPRFIKALAEKTPALGEAIGKVIKDTTETAEQRALVIEARQKWDEAYTSLKEVASAFLRLQGRREEMGALFKVNLSPSKGQAEAAPEVEAPEVEEPTEPAAPQDEA